MAHYAINMADGTVAIMQTFPQTSVDKKGKVTTVDPTPEECLAKWHPDEQAKVRGHQPIDLAAIPQDRTYRNAWTLKGDRVEHDMARARDLHRDHLRVARKPHLAALDVAHMRADEAGDTKAKATVAARKQRLRDLTAHPRIDQAATTDELKALTLEALTA